MTVARQSASYSGAADFASIDSAPEELAVPINRNSRHLPRGHVTTLDNRIHERAIKGPLENSDAETARLVMPFITDEPPWAGTAWKHFSGEVNLSSMTIRGLHGEHDGRTCAAFEGGGDAQLVASGRGVASGANRRRMYCRRLARHARNGFDDVDALVARSGLARTGLDNLDALFSDVDE
jgi:hypothetical protein